MTANPRDHAEAERQVARLTAIWQDVPGDSIDRMRATLEADTGLDLSDMSQRGIVLNYRALECRRR